MSYFWYQTFLLRRTLFDDRLVFAPLQSGGVEAQQPKKEKHQNEGVPANYSIIPISTLPKFQLATLTCLNDKKMLIL